MFFFSRVLSTFTPCIDGFPPHPAASPPLSDFGPGPSPLLIASSSFNTSLIEQFSFFFERSLLSDYVFLSGLVVVSSPVLPPDLSPVCPLWTPSLFSYPRFLFSSILAEYLLLNCRVVLCDDDPSCQSRYLHPPPSTLFSKQKTCSISLPLFCLLNTCSP